MNIKPAKGYKIVFFNGIYIPVPTSHRYLIVDGDGVASSRKAKPKWDSSIGAWFSRGGLYVLRGYKVKSKDYSQELYLITKGERLYSAIKLDKILESRRQAATLRKHLRDNPHDS